LAVTDFLEFQKAKDEQERAKQDWEDHIAREREEKEKVGEAHEPEVR